MKIVSFFIAKFCVFIFGQANRVWYIEFLSRYVSRTTPWGAIVPTRIYRERRMETTGNSFYALADCKSCRWILFAMEEAVMVVSDQKRTAWIEIEILLLWVQKFSYFFPSTLLFYFTLTQVKMFWIPFAKIYD